MRNRIAEGKVTVPSRTWKIVVVLRPGFGIGGITKATHILAVDRPNRNVIKNTNWKKYRVSVDELEAATGYDFLSNVPLSVQQVIEHLVDTYYN